MKGGWSHGIHANNYFPDGNILFNPSGYIEMGFANQSYR